MSEEVSKDFDIIEIQGIIKESNNPRKLYKIYDWICRLKEQGIIGQYAYDETTAPLLEKLQAIRSVRESLNGSTNNL